MGGLYIFTFCGGENFNFGWLKLIVGFMWEFCIILGTVLGRSSSLFELAMLDVYGLVALNFDGVAGMRTGVGE